MLTTKYIAYYRVSTQKQGATGLGIDAQRAMLAAYAGNIINEYVEVESGKRSDRPQLAMALAQAKLTGATLLIAKLDRLARNVHFISGLMESKVEFLAADMPTANRLTVHILAAVAEHEAEMISARTKAALQQARERGIKLGGYRGPIAGTKRGQAASQRCRSARSDSFRSAIAPAIADIKAAGAVTLRDIAAQLTARGYTTPRGGSWSAVQVQRMMA